MADPSDPPTTFHIRNFSSDLGGGADYSLGLVNAGVSTNSLVVSIASGATETSYCFTDDVWSPANAGSFGNTHWQTASWSFTLEFNAGNTNVDMRQRACRVTTAGTLIEAQAWTSAFTVATGIQTQGPFTYAWGKGLISDRIRWDHEYTETSSGSDETVELKRNDADSAIIVNSWWKPGMTPVVPGIEGLVQRAPISRRIRM